MRTGWTRWTRRNGSISPKLLIAPRYAEVALNRPLDQSFTYSIPAGMGELLKIGSLVEVPLRGQSARGVVTDILDKPKFKGPTKAIEKLLTPEYHIAPEVFRLAEWLKDYYWCALGEALAAASFVGLNDVHSLTKSHLALKQPDHWLAVSRELGPDGKKVSAKQAAVIHALLARGNDPLGHAELREEAGVSEAVLQTMIEREWLSRVEETVEREDDYASELDDEIRPPPTPTEAQSRAIEAILENVTGNTHRTFVLHGVTGSGKTEVYLRVIAEALKLGKTALALVPEIALTPQTVGNFRSRLGPLVGVYHSRLTLGQKFDLWKKIEAGETRVLIGARSAIFAPLPNLGVIVVDEEHETTFKQGDVPRYHARDVAVWRAHQRAGVAILGSATPSMESLHNALEKKYTLLELPKRIGPHAAPAMTIVDMKRNLGEGAAANSGVIEAGEGTPNKRPELSLSYSALLSPTLRAAIEKRIAAGEQTVLLLNRRGYANHVLCMKCEKTLSCPHCDVTLTYHKYGEKGDRKEKLKRGNKEEVAGQFPHFGDRDKRGGIVAERLVCHWCNFHQEVPKVCPKCGEEEIHVLGFGTQKVEDVIQEAFPTARAMRIDVDTMRGRRSFIEAWEKISRREVDIILGTQMIAKGFHLESVTLVGVISADFALFMPDFRGAERTFQLLTQVAGRAGRGDLPGEVIVQSFIPHHYAIEHAARLDEKGFYEKELHIRKMLRFPPIQRLLAALVTGPDLEVIKDQATRLANILKSLAYRGGIESLKVLGPAPAPIGKVEDQYRWRILLRAPGHREMHNLLREGLKAFEPHREKSKAFLTLDADPMDLL